MSLTGNLDLFPMEEVLRLLARTNRTGCLHVVSPGFEGRVYVVDGAITYATTQPDDNIFQRVVSARLTGVDEVKAIQESETLLDILIDGVTVETVEEFVFDLVVETIDFIQRAGGGDFEFVVDEVAALVTGMKIDADKAVEAAGDRSREWDEIEAAIPDLNAPLQMAARLPDEFPVEITPRRWKVLSQLQGVMNVPMLADSLGGSEFSVAKEVAELIREELIEFAPEPIEPEPEPVEPEPEPVEANSEPVEAEIPDEPEASASDTVVRLDPDELAAVDEASSQEAEEIFEEVLEAEERLDESIKEIVNEAAASAARFEPIRRDANADTETFERYVEPTEPNASVDEAIAGVVQTMGSGNEAAPADLEEVDEKGDPVVNPWTAPHHGVNAPGGAGFWEDPPVQPVQEDPWRDDIKSAAGSGAEVVEELDANAPAAEWSWDSVTADESKWVTPSEAEDEPVGANDKGVDWWGQASDQPAEVVADEADTFLEDVFSQLNQEIGNVPGTDSQPAGDEPGTGMGLLRRRRMGKHKE